MLRKELVMIDMDLRKIDNQDLELKDNISKALTNNRNFKIFLEPFLEECHKINSKKVLN